MTEITAAEIAADRKVCMESSDFPNTFREEARRRWPVYIAAVERLQADLAAAITVRDEAISDAEAHWDNLVVARNDARQLAAALEEAEGAIKVALAALREATK